MTRKPKWVKITEDPQSKMTLWQDTNDPRAYEARLPKSLGRLRRRFTAPNLQSAILAAPGHLGLVPDQEDRPPQMRIVDAFNATLQEARRGERSRVDWAKTVHRFMMWLPSELEYWHQITRQHLRDYLALFDGKADHTRRLGLQPVVQTARFMAREHGFRNVAEGLRLGSKNQRPTPRVYLSDVLDFLDHVRGTQIEAGVALQGLAGLQLQEATRPTWDKVDLDRGLIEISGEVKNEWRNRVIPICGRVVAALRRAARAKVQSVDRRVIPRHYQNHSKQITWALRGWNSQVGWQPKDLRNCILQFAVDQGLHGLVWEEYVGHKPRGVTARHYIARLGAVSLGATEALEKQMSLFRDRVVTPLDAAIEGRNVQDNPTSAASPTDILDSLDG